MNVQSTPPPRARPCRRPLLVLMVSLCALASTAVQAVEVEGMYQTRVEVASQNEDDRAAGFEQALVDVMIRVTGNSSIADSDDVEPLLDDAAGYVRSFRYRELDDAAEEDGADEESAEYELSVSFDDRRLTEDLEAEGVPVWGRRRPQVLLWVGVDEGSERYIVGEEDGADAREALRDQAAERALPLMFPILDLEDQERIEFVDIRAPFIDSVESASERYRPDTTLVGHVRRRGADQWTAEWTLLAAEEETNWRVRAEGRDELLAAGIDGATDRIASRLAGRDGETIELYVNVEGLDSVGDYAEVSEYLDTRGRVNSVDVDRIVANAARFQVEFEGSLAELQRTLALGDVLDAAVSARLANELLRESETEDAVALDGLVEEILDANANADGVAASDDEGDDADAAERERIEIFYRFAG